ncbi:protein phosphatase regulator [Exserohilum turcicum]
MTRPHIIRADTIDLQDKISPTAQDHSHQPERPAPLGAGPAAPHQQAAIRHVEKERTSEEARLHNVWDQTNNTLRDDPGSDDEHTTIHHANGHDASHDEQAVRLNGGAHGDADDADMQDADVEEDMDDDMMDKISSSPSIDDEDIDFEFVYALHTFVATVEGQANATKGDTMVLLDDSNSYWWLVRVSKDNSIGYLPAEHIETPTERLARLNKHRNIDLSATMLGDTAEKTKNPLKKAMRRRNAKTVQFAPPTYVEASDYDYSSDEGEGELFGGPEPRQMQQEQSGAQNGDAAQDDGMQVQPLKVNGGKKDGNDGDSRRSSDDSKGSEDSLDRPLDPKVSRNGTLRNTDSFFKDDNTETRKITLTPNILRDDSSSSTTGSRERGASLESLEKNGFADKVKDDKKKKEKKSGMLSGLFKRKDKKGKGAQDLVDSDMEKSEEADRSSPQSKPLDEGAERSSAEQAAAPAPLRQPSKGKVQRRQISRDDSPIKTKGILKTESPMDTDSDDEDDNAAEDESTAQQTTSSMRLVPPEQGNTSPSPAEEQKKPSVSASTSTHSKNPFSGIMKSSHDGEVKREKVTKAKQRVQLDDFDSDESSDPFADPDAERKSGGAENSESAGRLSESPVHVSVADAQASQKENGAGKDRELDSHHAPGLSTDSSSQETSSPISTPTPDDSPSKNSQENASPTNTTSASAIPPPSRSAPNPMDEREPSPPASSDSTILPAWSDASLRAYLDDGSEIRDMLVVINDTTGVVPVGPDHPLMKDYLAEEMKTMQGLSGELDRLLNGLMEKSMKRAGSAASKASTTRSTSANGSLNRGTML